MALPARRSATSVVVHLAALAMAPATWALNPVTWTYQQTIRRTDSSVSWTSPTAIDLGLAAYRWDYEITRATATALATVDILPQLGALRTGTGVTRDLPAVLVDQRLSEPTTGTAADLRIEVDAMGFGRATASNIALGTVNVLGFPIAISRIDLTATIRVEGFVLGDFNLDRVIDAGDYAVWAAAYGATGDVLADADRDGVVDAGDYTIWRDRASGTGSAVPEPGGVLLATGFAAALSRRLRI
jgi:hypothetical protein